MTECKDGKCACCDPSTLISEDMTFIEKLCAHIKGDILGKPLNGREYYYLMFGCVNAEEIAEIKDLGNTLKNYIDLGEREKCDVIIKAMSKFKTRPIFRVGFGR